MHRFFGAIWNFLRRYPVIPGIVLFVLIVAAILGPLLAPYDRDIGQSINGQVPPFNYTKVKVIEENEDIQISLSGDLPEGVEFLDNGIASLVITNDDFELIGITASESSIREGSDGDETEIVLNIFSTTSLEIPLEIDVSLDGNAGLNQDYSVEGLENFLPLGLPGVVERGVVILSGPSPNAVVNIIVNGDDRNESDENIEITISGQQLPEGIRFGDSEIVLTIVNDDGEDSGASSDQDETAGNILTGIRITPQPDSILEGQLGEETEAYFLIEAVGRLPSAISIALSFDGDATEGRDYLSNISTVVLPAGENSSIRLPITIIGDNDEALDLEAINPPIKSWWPEGYYLFGTDQNGRDVFTRLLHGARISMQVVAIALIAGMLLGTSLGIMSGYYGGVIDELITRFVDIWYALPFLLVALVFTLVFGRGLNVLMVVLALVAWAGFVRVIRSEVLIIKQLDYVDSARINGASDVRIMFRHILPGVFNTAVVVATLNTSGLILGESVLSFVGAGIQPPTPSWGVMSSEGRQYVTLGSPHISLIPGAAIFFVVLSFNFFGDWLRDTLDPRLRQIA